MRQPIATIKNRVTAYASEKLSRPSSVLRTASWTLFFLLVTFQATSVYEERDLAQTLDEQSAATSSTAPLRVYQSAGDRKASNATTVVGFLGASESFNLRAPEDNIASAFLEHENVTALGDAETLCLCNTGASLPERYRRIARLMNYHPDLIVMTINYTHLGTNSLLASPPIGISEIRGLNSFIEFSLTTTPLSAIERVLSTQFRSIRSKFEASLAPLLNPDAFVRFEVVDNKVNANPETRSPDVETSDDEVRPLSGVIRTLEEGRYSDGVHAIQLIASPATSRGVPVLVVVLPEAADSDAPASRKQPVHEFLSKVEKLDLVYVWNAADDDRIKNTEFYDTLHLTSFEPVIPPLWNVITDLELLTIGSNP